MRYRYEATTLETPKDCILFHEGYLCLNTSDGPKSIASIVLEQDRPKGLQTFHFTVDVGYNGAVYNSTFTADTVDARTINAELLLVTHGENLSDTTIKVVAHVQTEVEV